MKFRKKPVTIEAWQYHSDNFTKTAVWPQWLLKAVKVGIVFSKGDETRIQTLEGESYALTEGDWIIQGVKGELYPCKPDIFTATYELVAD